MADSKWPVPYEEVRGDRDGALARLQCWLMRAVVGGAGRLPAAVQDGLTAGLARVAARLDRRHADAARRFLEQAYGESLEPARREQLVRAAYRHLFSSVFEDESFDRRVLASADPLSHYDLSDLAQISEVLASGSGGLIATCHLGAWEAMAAVAPLIGLDPFYVVSRPPRNRPLSVLFQARRDARGFRLIPRHGAIKSIPKIVAAGGYVTLLLDQRARGKTVLAPFFGRPAHCERSIAVLARRLKKPLIIGAGVKLTGPGVVREPAAGTSPDGGPSYALRFPRVIWPDELAGMSPEQLLGSINAEFERMILAQPDQYLWLHDRYRKAPPLKPQAQKDRSGAHES